MIINSKLSASNHAFSHSPIHPFTHPLIHLLKKILIPFAIFFIAFFIIGCTTKITPVFVTIKSPKIKISDEGFLKEGFGYKEIIIYKAGNVPVKFLLKQNQICVNKKCFNKYLFIKHYFKGYKKNFFDKILSKKPLSLKNIQKTYDGFVQKSKNITYIVKKNSVLFKDRKNHIIIFIKYLKERG